MRVSGEEDGMRRTFADRIYNFLIGAVVTFICILCLYPIIHVLAASFSDPMMLMNHQGILLKPVGFSLDGYKAIMNNRGLWVGYRNTIFYVAAGTAINMAFTTVGAYVLSRKGYRWKKQITFFIVFTMYFTGGIIPNFLLVKSLGILNSRLALLLPNAIATWNLLVLRTGFASVPESLIEAPKIDGANEWQIMTRIVIPVSKASIAVIFLFYAVGHWNSWFNAMVYLPSARDLYPLQLYLREILISNSEVAAGDNTINYIGELVKYCAIIVSTIPILCIYPFVQKYFVKGVMMGSVKE